MSTKLALQLNAAVGMVTSTMAALTIWLVLTRPGDIALAVANRDYGQMAMVVAREALGLFHALLRFL